MGYLFQGAGNSSFWIEPTKVSPFANENNVLQVIADSHWSEDNQSQDVLWPRLSTSPITEHNPQEDYSASHPYRTTFFMQNGKYIKCKKIEVAKYFENKLLEKARIQKLKVYARVNNAFTVSDFDLWDVELGGNGFNYPIQRTYSLGLNLTF